MSSGSDFPGGAVTQDQPANRGDARDLGLVPRLGRPPGAGSDNSLQYFSLGNRMDSGAWQATVHGVTKKSDTTEHTHSTVIRKLVLVPTFSFLLSQT